MKKFLSVISLSMAVIVLSTVPVLASDTAGDESIRIPSREAVKSEEARNQVTLTAELPEHFGLSCYGIITDLADNVSYELSLYQENGYTDHLFLPDGTYGVSELAVYGDSQGQYPFSYPYDFTVRDGESLELTTTLLNFEEVENEIREKLPEKNIAPEAKEPITEEVYTVYQNGAEEPAPSKSSGHEKVWIAMILLASFFLLALLALIEGMKARIPGKDAYRISRYIPISKDRKES